MTPAGERVLESLAGLPGGAELLEVAARREDLALVGGAVRDILLGRRPRELDVVVGEGSGDLAVELAERLGGDRVGGASTTVHERFGTAVVAWGGARIDIAERRTESYPAPGALPEVRPGTVEEDLARRDFTVNAIAVALGGPRAGEMQSAAVALEDLAGGRLRVLHERSFLEDPTRLLRLARYGARLGFDVEEGTAVLAAAALHDGALSSISRARVGAELRLALAEADQLGAFASLADLGVLAAIHPRLRFERELVRCALALLPADGRGDLLVLASLLLPLAESPEEDPEPVMFDLLEGLELAAAERDRVMRTALVAPALVDDLEFAERPSELREVLVAHTIEAVALGAALGEEGPVSVAGEARDWLEHLRHVRLEITGEDLVAAGIPPGPEIGSRLESALERRLDGELEPGREAELRAALEAG